MSTGALRAPEQPGLRLPEADQDLDWGRGGGCTSSSPLAEGGPGRGSGRRSLQEARGPVALGLRNEPGSGLRGDS